mgnify:FL=1
MRFVFKFIAVATAAADQGWWDWLSGADPEEVAEELKNEGDSQYQHEKHQWEHADIQFGPDSAGFSDSDVLGCDIYHQILGSDTRLLQETNSPGFFKQTGNFKLCKIQPYEYQRAEILKRLEDYQ